MSVLRLYQINWRLAFQCQHLPSFAWPEFSSFYQGCHPIRNWVINHLHFFSFFLFWQRAIEFSLSNCLLKSEHFILMSVVWDIIVFITSPSLPCQVVCVGSIAELEELTGAKVTDLHRDLYVSLTDLTLYISILYLHQHAG